MIVNSILLIIQGILEVLLLPLTGLNISIDFISSIPVVTEFLQIVAYVLPWSNLSPLFSLVIAIFVFRAVIALIKLIWTFIPIIGN